MIKHFRLLIIPIKCSIKLIVAPLKSQNVVSQRVFFFGTTGVQIGNKFGQYPQCLGFKIFQRHKPFVRHWWSFRVRKLNSYRNLHKYTTNISEMEHTPPYKATVRTDTGQVSIHRTKKE